MTRLIGAAFAVVLTAATTVSAAEEDSSRSDSSRTAASAPALPGRVRRQQPTATPDWVNAIPDRIGDVLVEKHWYREGEVWGLAKTIPDKGYPYDEMGSATFVGLVKQYNLFDRVGELNEEARLKALRFWQSWQDPQTGRFSDPRDPQRVVNEKYVVGLISSLGGKPLYPWSTTGTDKKIETTTFLKRSQSDPDWQNGGWGVGSHTGFMAVEIFEAINNGQPELIPDLEKGIEQILTHQDADGLWGPAPGEPMRRIGGTLKIVGRLYFKMGMKLPRTREMADTLIRLSASGDWFRHGANSCVPRNVAEVTAYCLEVSPYRREDLLKVLDRLADDYRQWVNPDGSTLIRRGDRDSVGLQYTTIYGLGILGAYLNWQDCRLPNPLADNPRGAGFRYKPAIGAHGKVSISDRGE